MTKSRAELAKEYFEKAIGKDLASIERLKKRIRYSRVARAALARSAR